VQLSKVPLLAANSDLLQMIPWNAMVCPASRMSGFNEGSTSNIYQPGDKVKLK
jgi:hypothetical protein